MSRFFLFGGLAALALCAASPLALAQVPPAPAVAPAPTVLPAGAAGAGAAGAAEGAVKPGCLEKICVRCEKFRRKLCVTPAGALLNNITKPLVVLTGGVIPPFCPIFPSAADLAKPGVAGAAAEGKKDAAEAKARQMDVRYLGTLDCRYYPNAAKGLSDALRMDPSECVRFEAAQALSRGCCCNRLTLAALEASVSGTELDGNPAERSVRVRCTASIALEKCLACYVAPAPEPEIIEQEKGKELPLEGPLPPRTQEDKTKDAKPATAQSPTPAAIARARQTLVAFQELYTNTLHPAPTHGAGVEQSLYSILKSADPMPRPAMAAATPEPAPAFEAKSIPVGPIETPANPGKPASPSEPAPQFLKVEPIPEVAVPKVMPQAAKPAEAEPKDDAKAVAVNHSAPAPRDAAAEEVLNCSKKLLLGTVEAEKHAAVRALVKFDWMQHPRVASALLAGAASDQPAAIRVDCIRHLAHHNIAHPQVLADLQALTSDSDAWVKQEAAKALAQLK